MFGVPIRSARFGFELGGRFAPEFCRSFCVLRISCRCCRLSPFCSGLCRTVGACCRCGWLCCLGGLLSCRFCARFARGPCAKASTDSAAVTPSAINQPVNWSFRLIFTLHLLILIVARVVVLYRRWQLAQRRKIRNDIIIF